MVNILAFKNISDPHLTVLTCAILMSYITKLLLIIHSQCRQSATLHYWPAILINYIIVINGKSQNPLTIAQQVLLAISH